MVPNAQTAAWRRMAWATGTLSAGILGSRVLGLVRDMARAYLLGTGLAADAWVTAYRIPNLLRAFFAEGSLSAAFVPVISKAVHTEDRHSVWGLVNAVLSVLGVVLVIVSALLILAAPIFVPRFVPGFADVPGKLDLTIWLTRATFPYLVLIGLATVCMGTLNAFQHFRAPALAPGVMNLFMIGALVGLCPRLGDAPEEQVKGLAAGVLLGGLAQLAVQLPPLWRRGFRPRFRFDWRDPRVRLIGTLMAPGLVGIGVAEINAVVDTVLASLLETGSVASLEYGMRLMHLPLGVIGVALGTATLPTLSRHAHAGDIDAVRDTFGFGLRMVFFLMAPALAVLVVMPDPIVRLIFQRGQFDAVTSSAMTTQAVTFYGAGLLFYGSIKVTAPVFFAFHDTRTPVWCAAAALVSNIVLNLLLMGPMRLGGLALATALSAGLNVSLLTVALRRRLGHLGGRRLAVNVSRIGIATAIAALAMAGALAAVRDLIAADSVLARLAHVLVPLGAGAVSYLVAARALRCDELSFLWSLRGRVRDE